MMDVMPSSRSPLMRSSRWAESSSLSAAVSGGVGKISGAVIGALIMGVLNQGLSIMGVGSAWQQVIKGLVLLAAVAFDVMNRRRAGSV